MKMIFKDNYYRTTFEEVQIGELFSFFEVDAESPYVYLKLTDSTAFDLARNRIGSAPRNFNLDSSVRRIKGCLVVGGEEE